MTHWQPIETAPKDGSGFLYYQQLSSDHKWIGSAIWHGGQFLHVQWTDDESVWTRILPTHWMPLPEPPTAATMSRLQAHDGLIQHEGVEAVAEEQSE